VSGGRATALVEREQLMYTAAVVEATARAVVSRAARLATSVASAASLRAARRPRRSTSYEASKAAFQPVK
jgi:hypothetical protein